MKIIGLTGPSGSGKTLFCEAFQKKGIPTLNADELYHSMLKPPSNLLDALRRTFGDDFFTEDGELDRKKLGAFVFASPERLELLNSTVLPIVKQKMDEITDKYEKNGAPLILIDAPTLFEAGYDKSCDLTVSLLASKSLRIARIALRDGISESDAILRSNAQKPDEFYIKRSDRIIYNDGDSDALLIQAENLIAELFTSEGEDKNE